MIFNYLTWIFVAFYIVMVVNTVFVVLMENRQPEKTIAWILAIVMLPGLGIIAFYFFGQRLYKEYYIVKRTYNELTKHMLHVTEYLTSDNVNERYQPLVRFFQRLNHAILTAAQRISVYKHASEWIPDLLRDISAAQNYIYLETYIIEDDAVGRLVRDALIDKAREGVKVRLVYDAMGSRLAPRSFFEPLKQAGVEVAAFMPVYLSSMARRANYRDHRKICTIDGRVGYTGGMNIAQRYVSIRGRFWRDTHIRIEGAAVADMQRWALLVWNFVTGNAEVFSELTDPVGYTTDEEENLENCLVQFVPSRPTTSYPEMLFGLTWVFHNARNYIYIQTPYFMPSEPIIVALNMAALSGVDVRIMVPDKPDSFWLRWVNDSYIDSMLRSGVRVFRYHHGFLHSKAIVVDDEWCTVGSANLDFRSMLYNFEFNAFIYDTMASEILRDLYLEDLHYCEEIDIAEWRIRPYHQRLLESCTRVIAPLL